MHTHPWLQWHSFASSGVSTALSTGKKSFTAELIGVTEQTVAEYGTAVHEVTAAGPLQVAQSVG
jgi:hypothetical protein